MADKFILSCESTVDLPYSYIVGRNISPIFYYYSLDGEEFPDDMGRDPALMPAFYKGLEEGKTPSTSQINEFRYEEYLEELIKKGDVLHISFGTGMTPSVKNAFVAADSLRAKYPDRKITVIDSTCSSSGYGMLVDIAADMRDNGSSLEETADYIESIKRRIHHQFFTVDLKYFRKSGRISGATATIAAVLGICPTMRLDYDGKIVAYGKVRGKKNVINETVRVMEQRAVGGKDYNQKCFVCNSGCLADAEALRDAVEANFPALCGKVRVCDIGPIIASHCGPGTVAVFFIGDERPKSEN